MVKMLPLLLIPALIPLFPILSLGLLSQQIPNPSHHRRLETPFNPKGARRRGLEPYNYGLNISSKLKKRQNQGSIAIQSLPGGGRFGIQPYIRREIRDLMSDEISWNLYILVISLIQWEDQVAADSYFSISGIHGLPYQPWDNVLPIPGSENTGYCHHASVLFPTWHRVYLALYEQTLYDMANQIAAWFPNQTERQMYQDAARVFRVPYWDWAKTPEEGQDVFLDEFTQEGILVHGPAGDQTILNPLYCYDFHPLDSRFNNLGFNVWPETMRAPSDYTAGAYSQNNLIVQAMNQLQPSLAQRILALFSTKPDYVDYSNKRWMQFPNNTSSNMDSLESVHDTVHMACGQNGHFEYVVYSAFDPIFYLHHATVDRFVALWQIVYPESWVQPTTALEPSYTTAVGQIENNFSALTPFHYDLNGNFWDSNMCRNTSNLGYGYDHMMLGLSNNETAQREEVILQMMRLYSSSSKSRGKAGGKAFSKRGAGGAPTEKASQIDWDRLPDLSASSLRAISGSTAQANADHSDVEWLVNIRVPTQAAKGPFSVYIFLGQVPAEVRAWRGAPNLVGTYDVFAMVPHHGMNPQDYLVSGSVPLTLALKRIQAAGILLDTSPSEVRSYLDSRLEVRVATSREELDIGTIMDLSVSVHYSFVLMSETKLPQWSPLVKLSQLIGTEDDEAPKSGA